MKGLSNTRSEHRWDSRDLDCLALLRTDHRSHTVLSL